MIEFKNVSKSFKSKTVLNNINLEIHKGELAVLIGPSGCGKTTTLKMINKLIKPTSGDIFVNGRNIRKEDTIELRRNIGYVIQQTGLFPHMTISENISLIPRLQKWPEDRIERRTIELMDMVGMNPEEYLDRYPEELSGGQQQRVGVARAFAMDSDIVLMDEPFSALDPITKNQLQDELFDLQQELKKTIVFVTHDMDEAIKLGDRICIMKDGNILQFDIPEEILKNPAHGFVEEFIGKNRIWNKPEFIKARDIMITNPVVTNSERTIVQAVEIMRANKVDALMIVDKTSKLIGITTIKDIRRGMDKTLKLKDIMEKNIFSVDEEDSIVDVLKEINDEKVGYIPVLDNKGKLAGLITRSSLITVLSTQFLDAEEVIQ
ncbi:MAG: betaine/proline/choline family ABC transporter ATP-binding protein [Clostridium sp.]|jgi:osmoprotectant transport system ATP-binding protein|uniref:betaine/proline/choline family ABC transporter ATP-binding protein n=1 Tax=Clostridium sp. TaxID=1506 RepID=UPI0025BAC9A2|nr:betaine/proline/choline family ABC transporter ATP-binding protein [Clostridium sp.]MCH3963238.1 betaine/proline/choline family ABC transporter ATP-binding protein [Clostridium sp.]MCI1717210.1 betaine/proline/choline family ABC transporter ATP-binding protein [Clostridium sp.]MCI1801550.1 betaine/proline/choline family ABC transporter ATP-binding protein [Clostridium sp.]MCI1815396.1 betaine/proline/choline family ABC transporter ATP-binding protein [Clostridium sp.]MCI1872299.1 betaine/pr